MSKLSKILAAPLVAVLLVGGYAATSSATATQDADLGVALGGTDSSVVAKASVSLQQDSVKTAAQDELKALRTKMFEANVKFDGKPLQTVVADAKLTKQSYMNAVVWDSALEKVAVQRAFEQTLVEGDARPDGSKPETAALNGRTGGMEILASGTSLDVKGAIGLWATEQDALNKADGKLTADTGHLYNLLNPATRAQAFALVSGANKNFVVGQFYTGEDADKKAAELTGAYVLSSVADAATVKNATAVVNSQLAVGKTAQMTVTSGNLNLSVAKFASSATNVATVDEKTGVITGVAAGEATITATLADGTAVQSTVTVTSGAPAAGGKDLGKAILTTTAGEGLKAGSEITFAVELENKDIKRTLTCEYAADGKTFTAFECNAKLNVGADGSILRVTVAADGYQPKQLSQTFKFVAPVDADGTKTTEPKPDAVPSGDKTEKPDPAAASTSAAPAVANKPDGTAAPASTQTSAAPEPSETSTAPSAEVAEEKTEVAPEKKAEATPSKTESAKEEPKISVDAATVLPGGSVLVNGAGFAANEPIEVEFHSTPVKLGKIKADKDGAFTAKVTIPKSATPGQHHLVFNGLTSKKEAKVAITVNALTQPSASPQADNAKALPRTGGPVGVGIIAVVAVGACAIAFGARNAARRGDL